MTATNRFTSQDIALLAEDTRRYEVIEGELYVTRQPNWNHQYTCHQIAFALELWNRTHLFGEVVQAPGVIFTEDDDVAPDVVWISQDRLATALLADGKLHRAPELMVEVLSPGSQNEKRDYETKLRLYSRRGVQEYWIADWQQRLMTVYRRESAALVLVATLFGEDSLLSPLLPGFECKVGSLFRA